MQNKYNTIVAIIVVVVVLLVWPTINVAADFKQHVSVRGRVYCARTVDANSPQEKANDVINRRDIQLVLLSNAGIELFDSDVFWDSELDSVVSDRSGFFTVAGDKWEISTIEPYLRVTHNCPDSFHQQEALKKGCRFISDVKIPYDGKAGSPKPFLMVIVGGSHPTVMKCD